MYSGWRVISSEGAYSDVFLVYGTIIAGCSCANVLAKLALVQPKTLAKALAGALPGVWLRPWRGALAKVLVNALATALAKTLAAPLTVHGRRRSGSRV